jgi:2-amino-4-hydroxy-6-hydroxymethyldihydropteridine diphosphokinase
LTRQIAVAFGSNLGDRQAQILAAAQRVGQILSNFRLSTIIETTPVGSGTEHDPLYLNAVGVGESALPARALLEALQAIEADAGRTRPYANAPRTLDLDLVLVGEERLSEEGLAVPHPRFRDRRFVLEPLAELAPDLCDPVTGLTVGDLLRRI